MIHVIFGKVVLDELDATCKVTPKPMATNDKINEQY